MFFNKGLSMKIKLLVGTPSLLAVLLTMTTSVYSQSVNRSPPATKGTPCLAGTICAPQEPQAPHACEAEVNVVIDLTFPDTSATPNPKEYYYAMQVAAQDLDECLEINNGYPLLAALHGGLNGANSIADQENGDPSPINGNTPSRKFEPTSPKENDPTEARKSFLKAVLVAARLSAGVVSEETQPKPRKLPVRKLAVLDATESDIKVR